MTAPLLPGPTAPALALLRLAAIAALIAAAWAGVHVVKLLVHQAPAQPLLAFWTLWRQDVLVVGAMLAVAAAAPARLPPEGRARTLGLVLTVGLATAAGLGLWVAQLGERLPGFTLRAEHLPYEFMRHAALAALLVGLREFGHRRRRAVDALHAAELRRLAIEREADQARLTLLQAQIEPHFLFNSLANARRLMRTDPAAAQSLLGALLCYFEAALPRLREDRTTLGREADLVRAYLAVHQVRMGARLQAEVDVPAALAGHEVPPMLLLTLVENAIKHGVQPLAEGGRIAVSARHESGTLQLAVADTGRGMGEGLGGGTGLANLRARLRAMYGAAAALSLRVNEPRGVVAEVRLPA